MAQLPKSVHVIISGRVQGVSYRAWTVRNANRLGISGWVRNRTDGTVEAVFLGAAGDVDTLLEECRKGPLPAKVSDVEITEWSGEIAPGFMRLPTA